MCLVVTWYITAKNSEAYATVSTHLLKPNASVIVTPNTGPNAAPAAWKATKNPQFESYSSYLYASFKSECHKSTRRFISGKQKH